GAALRRPEYEVRPMPSHAFQGRASAPAGTKTPGRARAPFRPLLLAGGRAVSWCRRAVAGLKAEHEWGSPQHHAEPDSFGSQVSRLADRALGCGYGALGLARDAGVRRLLCDHV